ncbi:acyltransferase family protein [Vibrio algicola]|uniref:Acyltransferase family protein n=1 Tax=Vibrio algicola TaxID=2662262 RepID=A0A5Q0THG8_9VIBR|nr:acyltransferase [Vibrio algicola]
MKNEIYSLQVVRGIAALLVVTNHLWGRVFGGVFQYNGGLGVDVFFVLSGFLMVYTQTEKRNAFMFIRGRIERIYPLYWILSLPTMLMLINFNEGYKVISNLFLIPSYKVTQGALTNPPAWTLVYEMIFYVMFTFSLLLSKNRIKACLISVSIIFVSLFIMNNVFGGQERGNWINIGYILSDTLMLNFAFGAIFALIYEKIGIKNVINFNLFMFLFGLVLYVSLFHMDGVRRLLRYGIPSLIIIIFALYSKEGKGFVYNMLLKIGDASYSIYLSHIYFLYVLKATMSTNKGNPTMVELIAVLLVVLSIIVGIFINKKIEKPIMYKLKEYRLGG